MRQFTNNDFIVSETHFVHYFMKLSNVQNVEGGALGNSEDPEKDPRYLRLRNVAGLKDLPAQRKILSFFCML